MANTELKKDQAASVEETYETIASVPENMTILDTSFYIADAYRKTAGADIALITHNEAYRGNLMRFFKGDVAEKMVTAFKPRSFANNSKLVKVTMSGKQIVDALNDPVGNDKSSNSIYAYSGLKCEVAPWNELGSKYLSVKLADDSELDMDKLYSVAIWEGTVFEKYITEITEVYEGTWEDIMIDIIKSDAVIAAADDGRINLIWDAE